jgi:hypothetical protein
MIRDRCKRGAGYFLPGVRGCPPALEFPQDWGIRGLIETISAASIKEVKKARSEIATTPVNKWNYICA